MAAFELSIVPPELRGQRGRRPRHHRGRRAGPARHGLDPARLPRLLLGGEAIGKVDFKDLPNIPEKVGQTAAMAASNAAHLAGRLKREPYLGSGEMGRPQ